MIQPAIDIACLALSLYLTSLWGEYLFDDITGFCTEPQIMAGRWRTLIHRRSSWRTLLHVSMAWSVSLSRRMFGAVPPLGVHPFGLHLGNVGLHAVNGILLYRMLTGFGYRATAALAGALLFTAHPLAVNAVANISGRSSVFSGTFYFLALALAANGHFGAALVCLLPALAVKEDTIVLPLVLGALAYIKDVPGWWLFVLVPALLGAVLWKWIRHAGARTGSTELVRLGFPPPLDGGACRKAAIVETILHYPQWLFGVNQRIDHDVGPADRWDILSAALVLGGAILIGIAVPPVGLAFLLIAISPLAVYGVIVLPDPMMENRAYISLAGVAVLGAELFSHSGVWVCSVLIAFLAVKTLRRQHAWLDGIRLWTQAYKDGSTVKPRVLQNLNWAFQNGGDFQRGEYWARECLKICPTLYPARHNLSVIAERTGNLPGAIAIIEEAIQYTPNCWQAHKRLGQLHEMTGAFGKARLCYEQVLALNRKERDTWNQLGSIHFREKQLDEAMRCFAEAHRQDPGNAAVAYNIGMVHILKKDKPGAKLWLDKIGPGAQVPNELKELVGC